MSETYLRRFVQALEEGNIDADEDAMVSSIIRYVRSNSPKGSTDADIFKVNPLQYAPQGSS